MGWGRRLALVFCLAYLVACSPEPTVQQQVIEAIREMEGFAEQAESRHFVDRLDEHFTAQGGQMNRDQVRALMLLQLKRYQDIEVRLFPIDVRLREDGAVSADFRALLTGGPGWIPDSGQVYQFHTRWHQKDGDWVMLEASWEPVPLDKVI